VAIGLTDRDMMAERIQRDRQDRLSEGLRPFWLQPIGQPEQRFITGQTGQGLSIVTDGDGAGRACDPGQSLHPTTAVQQVQPTRGVEQGDVARFARESNIGQRRVGGKGPAELRSFSPSAAQPIRRGHR
jgi:hypothetical protein